MTTASTAAQPTSQGHSAWRLLAAVGLVLGATAFTVRSFVQSTGGEGSRPDQAAHGDPGTGLEASFERPLELTFAIEERQPAEIDALPLVPCELGSAGAGAEG